MSNVEPVEKPIWAYNCRYPSALTSAGEVNNVPRGFFWSMTWRAAVNGNRKLTHLCDYLQSKIDPPG